MMKSQNMNEQFFYEMKQISKLDFDFEEDFDSVYNVKWLSNQMRIYPSELVNTAHVTYEYNPEVISSILNQLKTDNCCVFLMSRDFSNDCDLIEPFYKTNYKVEDIPNEWKDQWQNLERHSDMFLPEKNDYIAEDLSLMQPDTSFNGMKYPER